MFFKAKKLKEFQLLYGPKKKTLKLSERPPAIWREHPALQNKKFLKVFLFGAVSCLYPDGNCTGIHEQRCLSPLSLW
jgi:hypothetical protein